MHYRYKGPVVLIPDIESWDFKGPKVLPEHATLPIPDNVDYSLRSRRCQRRIAAIASEFHRKRKALLQAEYQAQQADESLALPPSLEPHEPDT